MASSIVDDKRRLFQELHIKRAIHDYRGVVAFLCCCAIPGYQGHSFVFCKWRAVSSFEVNFMGTIRSK